MGTIRLQGTFSAITNQEEAYLEAVSQPVPLAVTKLVAVYCPTLSHQGVAYSVTKCKVESSRHQIHQAAFLVSQRLVELASHLALGLLKEVFLATVQEPLEVHLECQQRGLACLGR